MIERVFERALWLSRVAVLSAVVVSIVMAFGMLFVSTIDGARLIARFVEYAHAGADSVDPRVRIVSEVVEVIDGYLLGAILIIFAMGLYELFVSRIDAVEKSEVAARLLLIRSMDDLKSRLAAVIFIILTVKFFQQALKMQYRSPLDLAQLAAAIVLVAGALYLSRRGLSQGGDREGSFEATRASRSRR